MDSSGKKKIHRWDKTTFGGFFFMFIVVSLQCVKIDWPLFAKEIKSITMDSVMVYNQLYNAIEQNLFFIYRFI